MAGQLHCPEIYPGENGGMRVVHQVKATPKKGLSSHVYMERESKEHNFGPGQEAKAKAHIGKALGFKGEAEEEGEE